MKTFVDIICGICLMHGAMLNAQFVQTVYSDIGKTNVSDGMLTRAATISAYRAGHYQADAGIQWNFNNYYDHRLAGCFVGVSRYFNVWNNPLRLQATYQLNTPSRILREANWIVLMDYQIPHFRIQIGNNCRIYRFSNKYEPPSGLTHKSDLRITEERNLMYAFTGSLKTADSRWNLGLSFLSFDNFLIQQETNPMLMGNYQFSVNNHLMLYAECWYEMAGQFNIHVHHFGYYVKTGLSWHFP